MPNDGQVLYLDVDKVLEKGLSGSRSFLSLFLSHTRLLCHISPLSYLAGHVHGLLDSIECWIVRGYVTERALVLQCDGGFQCAS